MSSGDSELAEWIDELMMRWRCSFSDSLSLFHSIPLSRCQSLVLVLTHLFVYFEAPSGKPAVQRLPFDITDNVISSARFTPRHPFYHSNGSPRHNASGDQGRDDHVAQYRGGEFGCSGKRCGEGSGHEGEPDGGGSSGGGGSCGWR